MKKKVGSSSVTLVAISGVKPVRTLISLYKSMFAFEFKEIILVTTYRLPKRLFGIQIHKPVNGKLDSLDAYSHYCIYHLWNHINTSHCLLVQADSWITNPEVWTSDFLNYDYIGAPWPVVDNAYIDPFGVHQRVGNGGFSLRSRKLLLVPNEIDIPWNPNESSFYRHMGANSFSEDGNICVHNRHLYIQAGCLFAPLEVALKFSRELPVPEYNNELTFGFHKYRKRKF